MNDMVNHPPHYTQGGIETIDYLEAKLTPEAFIGYLQGNCLKYLSRAAHKWSAIKNFKKSQRYINRLVKTLESQ